MSTIVPHLFTFLVQVTDRITHVSTGGGASLALIEGKPLAALEALDNADPTSATA
jgi:3-phosphoglycerate kinase